MSDPHLLEEFKLSNGIPVLLQNYDGPVAACYWWNQVGSADEIGPQAGYAHFLEHMLFKDASAKETGKSSQGRLAQAIESLGGDINAYTSFDQTVYHVTCAEHHWEKVFGQFSAMAKPQSFLKSDFTREREVILEELRKNDDSPGRQLFEKLFELTYRTHPYGNPVIGYVKTLKSASVTTLERFYREHYCSAKMGLILVGPLTESRKKNLLTQAEKFYGKKIYPVAKPKKLVRRPEKPLRAKPEIKLLPFDVKTPTLALAFRVPNLKHPDVPAIDLLAGILGNGEVSRFYQKLFYGTSIATDAQAGVYIPGDDGMLYFQAETDTLEKLPELAEQLFAEANRIKTDWPTAEEIQRVVVNVESERFYSTQTADGIASRIGHLKFTVGDIEFDRKYLDDLKSVTPEQVGRAAAVYLDPRRMSVVLMVPKDQKHYDLKPLAKLIDRHFQIYTPPKVLIPAGKKMKAGEGNRSQFKLPVEMWQSKSGAKIAYLERKSSPVMSIYLSAFGGVRSETIPGLSHLMAQTWTKGTTEMDSRQISTFIEGNAASLEGFSGRNSVGLQLTGLARDWKKLSSLFTHVLSDAQFPGSEWSHSKRVTEDQLKTVEDHSSQLCSKLFLETLYENHPYGRFTIGDLDSLARSKVEDARQTYRNWIQPHGLTLSISGPVARSDFQAWLNELEGSFGHLNDANKKYAFPKLESEAELKAPRWVEKSLGREQIHIIVGGLGVQHKSEERFALRILQNILGGQSGRLFIELREKKSLAYTVAPMNFEGLERGYVGTYIACGPSKRQEAILGIREVLEILAKKGPSEKELLRAKEFYLGQRAMELQSDSSLASHFGLQLLYGFTAEDEAQVFSRVQSVTAQQVRDVCEKYFLLPHQVTSVVG